MAVVCLIAQVKKKMTCDEFLRNNRGINNGENLPPEFLQAIYDSIVRNEIRTTSEAETGAFEVSAYPFLVSAHYKSAQFCQLCAG